MNRGIQSTVSFVLCWHSPKYAFATGFFFNYSSAEAPLYFLQSFCAKRKQILTTIAASELTIQITGCSKWIVINPFAVFSHSFSVRPDLGKCKAAINGPKTHGLGPTQFFIQAHESKIVIRVGKSEFNQLNRVSGLLGLEEKNYSNSIRTCNYIWIRSNKKFDRLLFMCMYKFYW